MRPKREFQKALNGKQKAARHGSRQTIELASLKSPQSKASVVSVGGDSDDEDEEGEEGETTLGNIQIKRCPRTRYFQDPYGFVPPTPMEEIGAKGIVYPQAPPRKKRFVGAELTKLRQMVRQQNQQLLYSALYDRTTRMSGSQLTHAHLAEFEAEKQRIAKLTDYELERDVSQIDWDVIQSSGYPSRSAKELEAEWKLFCDPNFERGPWTSAEDEQLLKSVEARSEKYWDLVASDMGNRRLPIQYLARYQQLKPKTVLDPRETTARSYSVKTVIKNKPSTIFKGGYALVGPKDVVGPERAERENANVEREERNGGTNPTNQAKATGNSAQNEDNDEEVLITAKSGVKWTPEEDDILVEAVKKFGDKNWSAVATLLGGLRSGQQCLHRWQKTLNPEIRRGRWDTAEDNLLSMAVQAYGVGNWRLIHKHVPGRTDVQCRERYVNVLDPAVKASEGWSLFEDKVLLEVTASLPAGKWSLVAKTHNERMLERYNAATAKSTASQTSHQNESTETSPNQSMSNQNAVQTTSSTPNNDNTQQSSSMDIVEESNDDSRDQREKRETAQSSSTVLVSSSGPQVSSGKSKQMKMPSIRTDNQCWRRWKLLYKNPDVIRRPASAFTRRPNKPTSSITSKSSSSASSTPAKSSTKSSGKKGKARKVPDWQRMDEDDDEYDEYNEEEQEWGMMKKKKRASLSPSAVSALAPQASHASASTSDQNESKNDEEAEPKRSRPIRAVRAARQAIQNFDDEDDESLYYEEEAPPKPKPSRPKSASTPKKSRAKSTPATPATMDVQISSGDGTAPSRLKLFIRPKVQQEKEPED